MSSVRLLYNHHMRWLIFLSIVFAFVLSSLILTRKLITPFSTPSSLTVKPSISPKPTANDNRTKIIDVTFASQNIRVVLSPILSWESVILIPNFADKKNASTIVSENNCSLAINGGFYQKDSQPLGLFKIGEKTLGQVIKSNLVNGFFWQTKDTRQINFTYPEEEDFDFIFQSGPIFSLPRSQPVKIKDDKQARRSLIGEAKDRALYFIVLYDKDNLFSGPLLKDVPMIISQKELRQFADFTTLLNLDGGSASFFYSQDLITLSELISVGSLLCVK